MNKMEETYPQIAPYIYKYAWKFQQKYGGCFEDILSDANMCYILAFKKFNSKKMKGHDWKAWICLHVWKQLLNRQNKNYRINNDRHFEPCPLEGFTGVIDSLSAVDLLDSLKEDAKTVAELVIDPLNATTLNSLYNEGKRRGKGMLNIITEHLKQDLGWTPKRIRKTFSEIQNCLG